MEKEDLWIILANVMLAPHFSFWVGFGMSVFYGVIAFLILRARICENERVAEK